MDRALSMPARACGEIQSEKRHHFKPPTEGDCRESIDAPNILLMFRNLLFFWYGLISQVILPAHGKHFGRAQTSWGFDCTF